MQHMKHLNKFTLNENTNNDAMYAIADSFNKVKDELDLLNKRLGWSVGKNNEIDEFGTEIAQIKIDFDQILTRFKDFDNRSL